jgi:hypothetical protein
MDLTTRFALWSTSGTAAFVADVVTKAAHHSEVARNGAHTPPLVFIFVGCFLWTLGLWHSRLLAIGAGLMFGGLCGNAGELFLNGYATDWIPIGGWLTNVADICGAIGLLCCFVGYGRALVQRRTVQTQVYEA